MQQQPAPNSRNHEYDDVGNIDFRQILIDRYINPVSNPPGPLQPQQLPKPQQQPPKDPHQQLVAQLVGHMKKGGHFREEVAGSVDEGAAGNEKNPIVL